VPQPTGDRTIFGCHNVATRKLDPIELQPNQLEAIDKEAVSLYLFAGK
jgi:hypothetical protein